MQGCCSDPSLKPPAKVSSARPASQPAAQSPFPAEPPSPSGTARSGVGESEGFGNKAAVAPQATGSRLRVARCARRRSETLGGAEALAPPRPLRTAAPPGSCSSSTSPSLLSSLPQGELGLGLPEASAAWRPRPQKARAPSLALNRAQLSPTVPKGARRPLSGFAAAAAAAGLRSLPHPRDQERTRRKRWRSAAWALRSCSRPTYGKSGEGEGAAARAAPGEPGRGLRPPAPGFGSLKAVHRVRKCSQSQRRRSRKSFPTVKWKQASRGGKTLLTVPETKRQLCSVFVPHVCLAWAPHSLGQSLGYHIHPAERVESDPQGTTREVCQALVKSLRTLGLALPRFLGSGQNWKACWTPHSPATLPALPAFEGQGSGGQSQSRNEGAALPGQQDLTTPDS
ncbi:translation initiation factor IF-2-like [Lemur catta]|uniref:translation initiation factor IF-2-like n=1 Tax=Lemur catta TaxID=9447 RepID=UPI001E266D64|nr:translation initiation factor IF-2-like [Lemur catta]